MSHLQVEPAGLAEFAAAAEAAAEHTRTALTAATMDVSAVAPVFGLIGAPFFAAYSRAHAELVGQLSQVSDTATGVHAAALASAAAYCRHDTHGAAQLSGTAGGLA